MFLFSFWTHCVSYKPLNKGSVSEMRKKCEQCNLTGIQQKMSLYYWHITSTQNNYTYEHLTIRHNRLLRTIVVSKNMS